MSNIYRRVRISKSLAKMFLTIAHIAACKKHDYATVSVSLKSQKIFVAFVLSEWLLMTYVIEFNSDITLEMFCTQVLWYVHYTKVVFEFFSTASLRIRNF